MEGASLCLVCQRFEPAATPGVSCSFGRGRCAAFPDGIPDAIRYEVGDHGPRFLPENAAVVADWTLTPPPAEATGPA